MVLGARKDRGVRFYLTWHLEFKNGIFGVRSQVKSKYHYAKICVFWVTKFKFWLQHFTWNSRFGIQNVQLGKIWPRRFNGLAKTKLEPKFEVSISKNIDLAQQCTLQKVWKILLSPLISWEGLCWFYKVPAKNMKSFSQKNNSSLNHQIKIKYYLSKLFSERFLPAILNCGDWASISSYPIKKIEKIKERLRIKIHLDFMQLL